MAKTDPDASKRERNKTIQWVVTIFFVTILVSGLISLVSDEVMENSSIGVAFLILLVIIFLGIIFDIIGVAVTAADEKPFHSMAAKKVSGAQEAIRLLRNAERVSSICNDVVGDICGVISGSASAVIAARVVVNMKPTASGIVQLLMSALVAGLTVGGKAFGKAVAMSNSTAIIHGTAKCIYLIKSIPKRLMSLFAPI